MPDLRPKLEAETLRTRAIDLAIAAAAILPLLLTRHLPLSDLPNHLARQFILRDIASSKILQQFYFVRWQLVPNLALEIFVTIVRNLMPIDMAVRTFCILTILLLFFGTRLINRSLGRSKAYRIAPLMSYGGPFQFGFLSFCFGIGLALVMAGLYLRIRNASIARTLAVFIPCAFILLLCHLAAFGLFCIAICCLELGISLERQQNRPHVSALGLAQLRIFAFLLPAFLAFKLFSPMPGAANGAVYSTLQQKIESIAAITLFSSPGPELLLLAMAGIGLLASLFFRVVRLHKAGFLMTAVFVAGWLILPRSQLGGGYVDYRVPWAASFFLLSTLVPAANYEKLGALFGYAFAPLVAARIGLIAWLWLTWEPTLAGIDAALSTLPLGARVMVVRSEPPSTSQSRRPTLEHVAAYAVARRQAFETNIYSDVSGQILHLRQPYAKDWMLIPPRSISHLAPEYSHVLVLWPRYAKISADLPLICERSGTNFELYRVSTGTAGDPAGVRQLLCPI